MLSEKKIVVNLSNLVPFQIKRNLLKSKVHKAEIFIEILIRIQSDHLPSIAVILEALIQRIEKYAHQSENRITTSSPLPIKFLITLVDEHYKSYRKVQMIRVRPMKQI